MIDMRIQILPVKMAAKLMGLSENTIQAGLIQGRFPWGYAIQTSKNRWRYWINAQKFYETEGIRAPEEVAV